MCHLKKQIQIIILLFFSAFSALAAPSNYYQIKIGNGIFPIEDGMVAVPLIALGTRYELGDCALEISTAYGGHKYSSGDKFTYYTLPKITYVQFHQPDAPSGFYYGGGLSYSGVQHHVNWNSQKSDSKFNGVFVEGTFGYEFKRNAAICPIVYVDISQAAVPASKEGKHPGPAILFGVSAGF